MSQLLDDRGQATCWGVKHVRHVSKVNMHAEICQKLSQNAWQRYQTLISFVCETNVWSVIVVHDYYFFGNFHNTCTS